jgi:hypothetical protein
MHITGESREKELLRIVEGLEGEVEFDVEVQTRFGVDDIKPWLRQHDLNVFVAVGGTNALLICADTGLVFHAGYWLAAPSGWAKDSAGSSRSGSRPPKRERCF